MRQIIWDLKKRKKCLFCISAASCEAILISGCLPQQLPPPPPGLRLPRSPPGFVVSPRAILFKKLQIFLFCFSAWVGSLSIAVCLGCGPFVGSLLNRLGCRKVSIAGCLKCATSLTIASFANDLAILFLCYALLGAGASCVFLSSLEIVRKGFDKWRSIALGITSAGQGLGTIVLSQTLQFLVNSLRKRNSLRSLRVVAGCLAKNSLFGLLYDSKMETASVSEVQTSKEAGKRRTSKRFTFHCSVWKVPGFLVLTVI